MLTRCVCKEYVRPCLVITPGFEEIVGADLFDVCRERLIISVRNRPHSFSGEKSVIFPCLELWLLEEKCIQPDLHANQHPSAVILGGTKDDLWQNPCSPARMFYPLISVPFLLSLVASSPHCASHDSKTYILYLHGYDFSNAWHLTKQK